jgi:histone acetyltransferase MYST4
VGTAPGEAPPALIPVPFSPQAINAFMGYLQSQTQMNKMKMEYMRRREEREEKEHRTRLEASKLALEKEKQEVEEKRNGVLMRQKSEKAVVRAISLLLFPCSFSLSP